MINIVSYEDNEEGLYWGGGLIFRELAYIWNELMLIHGGWLIWGDYIGGGLYWGGGLICRGLRYTKTRKNH